MPSITPFLWFDNNVPEAVAFYKSVFPNAKVETVNDFMATFELEGQRFNALNGGPKYKFNEAISFFISVAQMRSGSRLPPVSSRSDFGSAAASRGPRARGRVSRRRRGDSPRD